MYYTYPIIHIYMSMYILYIPVPLVSIRVEAGEDVGALSAGALPLPFARVQCTAHTS
jgi:hypothetical protein